MRPLELELTNFLSYSGKNTLDLRGISKAVICGPNGSGKSSIVDGIRYALYGEARKRPEELINELSDEMLVRFTFSHKGETYTIERGQKGSKQSLKLFKGNENISERLPSATQKKLEDILGMSHNLLMATAISQQEDINKLSEMTPSNRERILSEMLCIEQWEIKKKKINDFLNDYKDLDKKVEEKNDKLNEVKASIEQLHDQIEKEAKYSLVFKDLAKKYEAELLIAEEKQAQYFSLLTQKQKSDNIKFQLAEYHKALEQLPQVDAQSIIDEIGQYKKTIHDNSNIIKEVDDKIDEIAKSINAITAKIDEINKWIALEPQTEILSRVPCAGMDIHSQCELLSSALTNKKSMLMLLEKEGQGSFKSLKGSLIAKRDELTSKLNFYHNGVKDIDREQVELSGKIAEKENILKELSKRDSIVAKIKEKELVLTEIGNIKGDFEDFDRPAYESVKDNFNKANKSLHEYEIAITKKKTEVEYFTKELNMLEKEVNEHNELLSNLANYRILYEAYNNIPGLLFEQAKPIIESYTNEILDKIYPGSPVEIRGFKETKSNTLQKTLDVVSMDGREFDNKSGSEKVRQSLALRVALARYNSEQNNIEMPFMVIDEGGFGSLDDDNIFTLKNTLNEIANSFDLFLIVTHISELRDIFDTQIVVNPSGKNNKIDIVRKEG